MKKNNLLLRFAVLVMALMCTLGASAQEAYACYTSSNTTLTFYYDNDRSSRSGTTYDLNTGYNYPDWYTDGTNFNVTKVVFDPSFAGARPTSTIYWFFGLSNLQSITGLEYLNTCEVTDMAWMFFYCTNLTSLDLSHFNTSKVNSMYNMLGYCQSLTSLDLSSFNTSQVISMSSMFDHCANLRTIYVGDGWNTAAVTISQDMFNNCTSLVGGQGTAYNESNPMDKTYAHIDGGPDNPGYFTLNDVVEKPQVIWCEDNATLYFINSETLYDAGFTYDGQIVTNVWSGSAVTATPFQDDPDFNTTARNYCTRVVFDESFATVRPTSCYGWFNEFEHLTVIEGIENLNTSNVIDMAFMFADCEKLTSLDLSNFNTANVTNMFCMFYGCNELETIYVGDGWNTAAVTYSDRMFAECYNLVGGQGTTYDANHVDAAYAHIDGGPSNPGYFTAKNAGLRGDVNCDNDVNISDVTALIDLLLGGGTISNSAADCNQDGQVSISDVTVLIDYLLSGNWP